MPNALPPMPGAAPAPEEILGKIQDFDNRANMARTAVVQSKQTVRNAKTIAMQRAFRTLQGMGVNPADPASLNAKIAEIQEKDPDGAELFTSAIDQIFKDEEVGPPGGGGGLSSLMQQP